MTAGAYGAAMSSTYNTRLLVPEVLVKGDDFAVVRPRQSYDELIGLDRLPDSAEMSPRISETQHFLLTNFRRLPRLRYPSFADG